MVVEVLPDVSGIDRTFAYEVPGELACFVKLGSVVKVVLNRRRVRGWVVGVSDAAPPGIDLHAIEALVSLGPPPEVVELARWAAWRYAGRLRPMLVAACAPRVVRALPPPCVQSGARGQQAHGRPGPKDPYEGEIIEATRQALSMHNALLRLPPAAPRLAVVRSVIEATCDAPGDVVVLAASSADALVLSQRLERLGHVVALQPTRWAEAASGGRVVVGTRSTVLCPVPVLRALVVLDAHADSYRQERVPTWEATVLAEQRAKRAGVPCLFVSACPGVELSSGRPLVTLSRDAERNGWAPIEVLDAREEDPHAGGYSTRLASLIRSAVSSEPTRPVVAVLNRKGRARLLSCGRCRSLLRCDVCGTALVQLERPAAGEAAVLDCPRCSLRVPAICATCGPTKPRVVRPGVARARDDLAALTGLDVVEVGGTRASGDTGQVRAPVLIGTQAVLHRVNSASIVVFLDFDQEIVAARYRAGEQALGLLALASRRVAGRSRLGRVVVRTRLPDHEVITAALHADPGILSAVEASRREMLRLPPTTALALLSGDGSPALGEYLAHSELGLEVGGLAAGRILVRAATPEQLADALASASALAASARVEVSPSQV